MRYILCILMFAVALIAGAPPANADLGGEVPSPGNCDYPAVGNWGLDGPGVYHWVCDFPTEINGSHHHCQTGGVATNLTVGVSFMFVNASIQTPTGIIPGICYWACPDMSAADPPNPPGSWKTYLRPAKCKTVAPAPMFNGPPPDAPPPPAYIPPATNLNPTNPNPETAGK